MELEPYLHFGGVCEEALTFYKEVFAGEVVALMRYSEMQGMPIPPGYETKVMHSSFKSTDLKFMASDQMPGAPEAAGANVSLSLSTHDVLEGRARVRNVERRRWNGHDADGGHILGRAFRHADG